MLLLLVSDLATVPLSAQATGASVSLSVPLVLPSGVAQDAAGNLYVAETGNHRVLKLDAQQKVTIAAGGSAQGFAGDGGPAVAALLDSPEGLAVDAAGNIYIADTHNHRVRRVDGTTGILTTVAGTGTAGHGGDGGPAVAAQLSTPVAIAVNGAKDLFIADRSEHRIRRVDGKTGLISTVAGTGIEGYAGDGGPAAAAEIDSPTGIAIDSAGNLYLADTHNQRIRVIAAASGVIRTLAGTGAFGSAGDLGQAGTASLANPRGVTIDASGNVLFADSANHRVRMISPAGVITTIAGDGVQGFAGDGGSAVAASVNSPRAVVSAAGPVTFTDTGNGRLRQIGANNSLATALGEGAGTTTTSPGIKVALTVPASGPVKYGDAMPVTATVSGAQGGVVTLLDGASVVGSIPATGGMATFSTADLGAGTHSLIAQYGADRTHVTALSGAQALTVQPLGVTARAAPATKLFGQALPVFSGSLTGVLQKDASSVGLGFTTPATRDSPVGSYPIVAGLSGAGSANYAVSTAGASGELTIARAPAAVGLLLASASVPSGSAAVVMVHVAATTSGVPSGSVTLLDGGAAILPATLSAAGDATLTVSSLKAGVHGLSASYAGDGNFLAAVSGAQLETITDVPQDFLLTAAAPAAQTIGAGKTAVFGFTVLPLGGPAGTVIDLSVSGLPAGAMASFDPAYVPPGGTGSTVTLTVVTPLTAKLLPGQVPPAGLSPAAPPPASEAWAAGLVAFGLMLPLTARLRRSARLRVRGLLMVLLVTVGGLVAVGGLLSGCGARTVPEGVGARAPRTYKLTVTGTGTTAAGTPLVHSAVVTLTVE